MRALNLRSTRPSRFALTAAFLLPLSLVAVVARGGGDGKRGQTAQAAPAPDLSIEDAVELVLRATVIIEGDGIYGSGILIDPPNGIILTSHHVVDEMKAPRVRTYDGRKGGARIIARDTKVDLALLSSPELRTPDLPAPRFADASTLRAGEEVFAIGSPRKLPFTVSRGIVSYVGRPMDDAQYLQLDMAINDGNSGGPVFTKHGEVVGIMSFILRHTQGLSFALPVSYAAESFPQYLAPIASRGTFHQWLKRPEAEYP